MTYEDSLLECHAALEKAQAGIDSIQGLLFAAVVVLVLWIAISNYEITLEPDDGPEDKGPPATQ